MTQLYEQLAELTAPIDPWWIIGGMTLLLFLIIVITIINRSQKKSKARKNAPLFQISGFQVAPLGRDASCKITNQGEVAVIEKLHFKNRYDIQVKNWARGQQLDKNKSTRLMLETQKQTRISDDLILEIEYQDRLGNLYRQSFPMTQNAVIKNPKLLRYA